MSRTSIAATVALLATLGSGCAADEGENGDEEDDGELPECFESGAMPEGATLEGAIEIGTGEDQMEVLAPEQELTLIHGIQGGFHFEIRTRIDGLDGGDAGDTDPDNLPATFVSAYDEGGDKRSISTCFYLAYPDGELPYIRPLVFNLETKPTDGERMRIVAEILDRAGRYATSEIWVVTADDDVEEQN